MTEQLLLESPLPGGEQVENEITKRMNAFAQIVDNFSTNRKSRRQFKKFYGVMPPAKNLPYVKPTVSTERAAS